MFIYSRASCMIERMESEIATNPDIEKCVEKPIMGLGKGQKRKSRLAPVIPGEPAI